MRIVGASLRARYLYDLWLRVFSGGHSIACGGTWALFHGDQNPGKTIDRSKNTQSVT